MVSVAKNREFHAIHAVYAKRVSVVLGLVTWHLFALYGVNKLECFNLIPVYQVQYSIWSIPYLLFITCGLVQKYNPRLTASRLRQRRQIQETLSSTVHVYRIHEPSHPSPPDELTLHQHPSPKTNPPHFPLVENFIFLLSSFIFP